MSDVREIGEGRREDRREKQGGRVIKGKWRKRSKRGEGRDEWGEVKWTRGGRRENDKGKEGERKTERTKTRKGEKK